MKRHNTLVWACGILLAAAGTASVAAVAPVAAVPPHPRLAVRATNPTCPTTPLNCNNSVNGSLTASDCQEKGPSGSVGTFSDDFYQLAATAGQQIAISLASATFDTYLIVEDGNGNPLIQDDDSGGGTNSQVSFIAPTTGTYYAIASSSTVSQSGDYSLTLSCSTRGATTCSPTTTTLCLNNRRFEVSATFQSPGQSGVAQVVPLTDDTGYLWFFAATNVETVLKVLDGCSLGNHYWFFAGGLTNVYTQIKVVDTSTGFTRLYTNPLNEPFQPIQDTSAFPDCP
jgi:hypothetical protein